MVCNSKHNRGTVVSRCSCSGHLMGDGEVGQALGTGYCTRFFLLSQNGCTRAAVTAVHISYRYLVADQVVHSDGETRLDDETRVLNTAVF